ncbi:MAG: hypothetical protein AAB867_01220 [Patescibacteria group bacterium]
MIQKVTTYYSQAFLGAEERDVLAGIPGLASIRDLPNELLTALGRWTAHSSHGTEDWASLATLVVTRQEWAVLISAYNKATRVSVFYEAEAPCVKIKINFHGSTPEPLISYVRVINAVSSEVLVSGRLLEFDWTLHAPPPNAPHLKG